MGVFELAGKNDKRYSFIRKGIGIFLGNKGIFVVGACWAGGVWILLNNRKICCSD